VKSVRLRAASKSIFFVSSCDVYLTCSQFHLARYQQSVLVVFDITYSVLKLL